MIIGNRQKGIERGSELSENDWWGKSSDGSPIRALAKKK